jgi:hypothetical protein
MAGLFGDMMALIWIALLVIGMIFLVYMVLFWIYFGICKLNGPVAIRIAWTVGILSLLIVLAFIFPFQAPYFNPLSGDIGSLVNLAIVTVISMFFLIIVWVTKPSL